MNDYDTLVHPVVGQVDVEVMWGRMSQRWIVGMILGGLVGGLFLLFFNALGLPWVGVVFLFFFVGLGFLMVFQKRSVEGHVYTGGGLYLYQVLIRNLRFKRKRIVAIKHYGVYNKKFAEESR